MYTFVVYFEDIRGIGGKSTFTFKLGIHLLDTLSNKFVHFNEEGEFWVCKITMELRVFSSYKNLYI